MKIDQDREGLNERGAEIQGSPRPFIKDCCQEVTVEFAASTLAVFKL